ncbi:4800_t:CDS:10 [Diversispora eburnea]|uniref:4800_t:CDS:1 n=1 Tax=Diversispora eburnea TaxID=1213867 RepID=A0A9N9FYN0_9GLOM|nr:4800_t:CDS:10 [Diversispora eburnea]
MSNEKDNLSSKLNSSSSTKQPLNVFAQPHFRSKIRLPFKDFQKNVNNDLPKPNYQQNNNQDLTTASPPIFTKFISEKSHVSKPEDINISNNKNKSNDDKEEKNEEKIEKDELGMIIEIVHRWKDDSARRDSIIKELRDNLDILQETINHRDIYLTTYRERILTLELLIKRQQSNSDHNRERVENIKSKYFSYRNTLSNIEKSVEEIREEKKRIENDVESLRCDFGKIATKYQSVSEYHISNSLSQRTQITQVTDLNHQLTDANTQLNNVITQLSQVIQNSNDKAASYASELDSTRKRLESVMSERDIEKAENGEECQKLKLSFESVNEKYQTLNLLQKENEEKIIALTKCVQKLEQDLESSRNDIKQLNSLITEKDKRYFKKSYPHLPLLREIDSIQKEMDTIRTQQMIECQKFENELHDLRHQLQTEFYKERCQLETEWANERSRLESENREERTRRLRLESEFRDERSERFRFETELHNSDRKLKELLQTNDHEKIVQLESELGELENQRLNRISASSLESRLNSLATKFDEFKSDHNKVINDINQQHDDNVDKLNRDVYNYQEIVKQTTLEHENEICQRDCEIREIKSKEILMMEEIEMLKSKIHLLESNEQFSQKNLQLRNDCKMSNISIPGPGYIVNSERTETEPIINEVVVLEVFGKSFRI